jgi:hypothetical protein
VLGNIIVSFLEDVAKYVINPIIITKIIIISAITPIIIYTIVIVDNSFDFCSWSYLEYALIKNLSNVLF